jgi:hypothetical protein
VGCDVPDFSLHFWYIFLFESHQLSANLTKADVTILYSEKIKDGTSEEPFPPLKMEVVEEEPVVEEKSVLDQFWEQNVEGRSS